MRTPYPIQSAQVELKVDECKPLLLGGGGGGTRGPTRVLFLPLRRRRQGLTFAHFRAQLGDLRDTSLTIELNLSTFGTRPRVNLGHMVDKVGSK